MSQHTSKLTVIYPQSISTIQKLSKNARNERIDELLRWDNHPYCIDLTGKHRSSFL